MIPETITIAMMKVPDGQSWKAQIHIEYGGNKKDVAQLNGDNALQLLSYCQQKLQKKLEKIAISGN